MNHGSNPPDLRELLRDCYHPLLRRNVIELNMLRSATATADPDTPPFAPARYMVELVLTAPGHDETANAQFIAQIENRLLGVEHISKVHIHLLPSLFPIL